MRTDLQHETIFYPAYDKRAESGGKYGQHCADLVMYCKGPLGIVQFKLFTGWSARIIAKPDADWQMLQHISKDPNDLWTPMPADLGYHSPTPRYEDQHSMKCSLLPQGECYYDGSGLNAARIFSLLVHEGSDAVWKALEEEYARLFETEVTA